MKDKSSHVIKNFSFCYFSSIANVVALSILYITHPNKHNNHQFNVQAILQKKKKKDSNPCQTWGDLYTYMNHMNLIMQ